jgi:DNA-binding LytR/AlgR family response regulator
MYHFIICEDEEKFVTELSDLLVRYFAEQDLPLRVTSFKNGQELIEQYPVDVDLIFLDIQMDKMNGLLAAEKIRKRDATVSIIFLTSLVQHALEGYKYNAVNYIIKPIKYVRLKYEMDKWLTQNQKNDREYLLIENDTGKYKVRLQTLSYIETYNRNLMLHTDTENILSYKKMKDMEAELSKHSFVRCHSGYLVNLFFIKRVEKLEIELINGEFIPISQLKRKTVMEKLTDYWGDRL